MKRTKLLFSTLALVLAFSGSAFGQTNITASADIVEDVTVGNTTDLSFGQISNSQTTDAIIDPTGAGNSGVGNSPTTGFIEFTAAASSTVLVNISDPGELTDDDSNNTIEFTPDYNGNIGSDSPGSSNDLTAASDNTINLDSSGEYYIYLGGTLTGSDIEGATTGTYDATISTTISYQ